MSIKDYLKNAKQKNEEIAQTVTVEAPVKEERRRSSLYWFFFNTFKGIKNFAKKHKLIAGILLMVLLYFAFVGRAGYQPAFVFLRRYFLLAILFMVITYFFLRHLGRKTLQGKVIRTAVYLGLVALIYFFGRPIYEYLGLYQHYKKLEAIELKALPETYHERIQPLNAIRTLVNQELLSETESATDPKFIKRKNGDYNFSMALGPSPKYKVQRFSKDMYKVISVSATNPAPDFSAANQVEANFDIGEFLLFSRRTYAASVKSFNLFRFFNMEPADVRFIENDAGEWVQVVSLVKWKGLLIPRPVFGGVIVIKQNSKKDVATIVKRIFLGRGKFIPVKDIANYEYLKGQNIIPIKVSEWTAKSFRFQEGFFAPMPGYHEGDIRIPSMESDQNAMPFIAFFEFNKVNGGDNKLYNYFGLEPYEKNKLGLNTSLFIPSDGLGDTYYIDHSKNQDAFIGSSAVPSKIIESRKNYDWTKNHPAEFRPFIRYVGGKPRFFWLSTVVTKTDDARGGFIGGTIPEVTITDARYSQVVWITRENLPNTKAWNAQIEEELSGYWGD